MASVAIQTTLSVVNFYVSAIRLKSNIQPLINMQPWVVIFEFPTSNKSLPFPKFDLKLLQVTQNSIVSPLLRTRTSAFGKSRCNEAHSYKNKIAKMYVYWLNSHNGKGQMDRQPYSMTRGLELLLIITLVLLSGHAFAGGKNSGGGFIDFNIYPYMNDVDNDNTITINMAAKLKHRFSYFSLTNYANQENKGELSDSNVFYTEQNVRWQIADNSPLDLTLQMNFRTGHDNDRHRLGIRWRLNNTQALSDFFKSLNLSYAINLHAIQFDSEDANVWQLEHAFRMTFPYLSDRLYLAGFVDHTFNQDLPAHFPDSPIVGEAQLGYELFDNFFAIAEYRVNQYRRSDVNNLAIGLEYKIVW